MRPIRSVTALILYVLKGNGTAIQSNSRNKKRKKEMHIKNDVENGTKRNTPNVRGVRFGSHCTHTHVVEMNGMKRSEKKFAVSIV